MFKKIILLFIFLIIKLAICSINSNDFCRYNLNEEMPCMNKHRFKCETKSICASNPIQCELFDYLSYKMNKSNSKEFQLFKKNMPLCKIDLDQFCLSSTDCFETRKLLYNGRVIRKLINKVDCKCQGKFGHKCKNYCGNNSNTCKIIQKLNLTKYKVKKCSNRSNYTLVQRMGANLNRF